MRIFSLIFLLALCSLADVAAQFKWNTVMLDGRTYVPVGEVSEFYRMRLQTTQDGFQLTGKGNVRSIAGQAEASELKIDGVKYALCFPIKTHDGQIYISAMDTTKIIEPILRPAKIKNATAVHTVILDAGHGGHDGGATGDELHETDMALDVVHRAARMLKAQGYRVVLTRKDDTFMPLEKRLELANRTPNAVFISVYFGDGKNSEASGIETFVLTPRGVSSMGGDADDTEHPGNARDAENILLAATVHSAMVARSTIPDLGIKRGSFPEIRDVSIPSILIRGGAIANPDSRQSLARAIANGVDRFRTSVAGQYVPASTPTPPEDSTPPAAEDFISPTATQTDTPAPDRNNPNRRAVEEKMMR